MNVQDRLILARLRRATRSLIQAVDQDACDAQERPHGGFLPWPEQAALYRLRMQQPITYDGEVQVPTVTAATELSINPHRLHMLAKQYPVKNAVVVTEKGARFIRVPRDRTDLRAPVYWDLKSLRGIYGNREEPGR